jgi:hypothetical protein
MIDENVGVKESAVAGIEMAPSMKDDLSLKGAFSVVCTDADGNVKWTDEIKNLVTTAGKNDVMDKYHSGAAYTASPFMGLKGAGAAAAGDTQASHGGWLEVGLANQPTYSGNRKVPAYSAAAAGVKATSSAVSFTITGTGTVAGCFINMGGAAAIDSTGGVLYSAGDFTLGARAVQPTDILNVTYSTTAT